MEWHLKNFLKRGFVKISIPIKHNAPRKPIADLTSIRYHICRKVILMTLTCSVVSACCIRVWFLFASQAISVIYGSIKSLPRFSLL